MDWSVIITTFLTSCVPALISYFASRNKNKADIDKLKLSYENEIEKLKLIFAHENNRVVNEQLSIFAPQIAEKLLKEKSLDEIIALGQKSKKG